MLHNSPTLLPPGYRQPLIYFLSLQIFLFWTFHINRLIQICILLRLVLSLSTIFSRFIHFVALILYFFLLLNNITLYVYVTFYLPVHWSVKVHLFGLLLFSSYMNNTAINIHVQIFTHTYIFIFLGYIPPKSSSLRRQMPNQMVTLFQSSCNILRPHQQCARALISAHWPLVYYFQKFSCVPMVEIRNIWGKYFRTGEFLRFFHLAA